MKFNLQFFAEDSPTGQKTEKATPRRKQKAREKGQVAKSVDLSGAIVLITGFVSMYFFGGSIAEGMKNFIKQTLLGLGNELTISSMRVIILGTIMEIIKLVGPIAVPIIIAAIVVNLYQNGGILITFEPFKFKPESFNPVSNIKKKFSSKMLVELLKSIFKIIVVGYFPYKTIKASFKTFILMSQMELPQIISITHGIITKIIIQVCFALLIISLIDYLFQIHEYEKNLMMSKYDVKQEMKDINGNPLIKQEQRKRGRSVIMKAMMNEVPNADVVLTNPTHIAVALRYDPNHPVFDAPYIVAMGAGHIAERIKAIAKESGVPVMENKPLARQLYKLCDIGDEIPQELFGVISEILAMVYQMNGKINEYTEA